MILKYSRTEGDGIITDLRGVDPIHIGNRFLLYSLFPEQNISIWIVAGLAGVNSMIGVGHSIVDRSSTVDVGKLMASYGGGGHMQVGTCQVAHDQCDAIVEDMIKHINDHNCKTTEMES